MDKHHAFSRRSWPIISKATALAAAMLCVWSALFIFTYRYSFFWDDYQQVRPYSWEELRSTLHGYSDPDRIQTDAYRPLATFLFAIQGWTFGENVVFQRIFLTFLTWILLFCLAILLAELRFRLFQIAIILGLFVFSRVFASVNMWLTLAPLVLCYIFMILAGYLFVRWTKRHCLCDLLLMFTCAVGAVFTREEAYVLAIALPLLWFLSTRNREHWHRVVLPTFGVVAIIITHVILRQIFVPDAPTPDLTTLKLKMLMISVASSWLPGGYETTGIVDWLSKVLWLAFLAGLLLNFLIVCRSCYLWRVGGICCLGIVLALPALGIPRSFGISLATAASATAIATVIGAVHRELQTSSSSHRWRNYTFVAFTIFGLAIGIGGGIRRSMYVAESLDENCVLKVALDADFIFNVDDRHITIPEQRIEAGRDRLRSLGIFNVKDLRQLDYDFAENPERYERNRQTRAGLFLPKYEFLSY